MMMKIESTVVENTGKELMAELFENRQSGVKKLCVFSKDTDGVTYEIGKFTPCELQKGQCMQAIGNAFPELMLHEDAKGEQESIVTNLKKAFVSLQAVEEEETMNACEVHKLICEYVKNHEAKDYMTYDVEKGVCIVEYEAVNELLKTLQIGWSRQELGRMLKRQGLLHEGSDRKAKLVTMSNGGGQYRALVFDIEFKEVHRDE